MKPERLSSCDNSTFGCENGAFLPMGCANTRNTADAVAGRFIRLEGSNFAGSIKTVVAAPPQWAETHSLIRYPSPYGRSCTFWCRPPFFHFIRMTYGDRRGIAQNPAVPANDFDRGVGMALNRGTSGQMTKRGSSRCDSPSYSSCPSWRLPAFLPVATRWASRRLSGQAPVRAPRWSSTAASPAARLSALRGTSPIARPIHAAANRDARALTGATDLIRTTGTFPCAGGFFDANSACYEPRPGTDSGDERCSRKS